MAIQNDFTIYPKTKVVRHTSGTTVYSAVAFYSWLMDTFDEPGYLTYQTPIRFNTPTSFTMINGWFLDNGESSYILKFIYGGGIDTSGYATVADPVYMVDLDNSPTTYTSFVAGDKDKRIEDDDVIVGPLLTYINSYPSANKGRIWVRDTRVSPATIADNSKIDMTADSGTGTGTADGAAAIGDEIYLNLFTIASFAGTPNPQPYIYQRHPVTASSYNTRVRIGEWSNLANWDRDAAGPTNIVDILFPIKLGGTLIDSGNFKTFVRQTGDTYTFVESTVTESGRTPIATETAADTVNITKGEHYMFYTSASNPAYTVGTVIQDVATGGATPPTWYAEIVAHTNWSASSGYITLRGLRGVPAHTNPIFVGATQLGTAIVNRSVGDTIVSYDAEGTGPVAGDIGLPVDGSISTAERILRAFQDDGTTGKLLLQVYHTHGAIDGRTYTGTTRDFLYKQFVDNDVITAAPGGSALLSVTLDTTITPTTIISGYSDVTVAHMNGTVICDTFSGTFISGERVTWAGGGPAILIESNGSTSISLGNVESEAALTTDNLTITGQISGATCLTNGTGGLDDENTEDFAFSLQSAFFYSIFIEGGSIYETGRSLSDIYGYLQYYVRDGQDISSRTIYTSDDTAIITVAAEEYIKAVSTYSATKTAPFGTLAGSTFFGAQGVWIQGMQTTDNNNIKLTDHGGTLRQPDVSITVSVTNTRADDRIAVYLEDGTTTLPDKDTYASHATNNAQADSTFERTTGSAMPNDTPLVGTIVAVDVSVNNEEHRYRYLSRNGTSTSPVFTLPTKKTGTGTSGSVTQTLVDSGATFTSGGTSAIQVGDIIRRTNGAGGWGYVTVVTSATQLSTTLLSAGAGWAVSDTYELNALVVLYTGSDTFFVPYLDIVESTGTDGTPGTESVSLNYTADREVVIEIRNVKNSSYRIVPFKTTGTITTSGLTQSVIRTADTVYA